MIKIFKALRILILTLISVIILQCFAMAKYTAPKPIGYVNDFAEILSSETKTKLENNLKELDSQTGAQIALVTLKSLNGYPIEDVGLTIGRDWKVGQKGKNNGVVILVAPTEKKLRIEIGYGLEGTITDSMAGRIRDQYMIPYFKIGDYEKGIIYGTTAITTKIADSYGKKLTGTYKLPPENPPISLFDIIFFIFIISIIIRAITYKDPYSSRNNILFLGGFSGFGGFGGSSGFGGFGGGGFGGGGASGGW